MNFRKTIAAAMVAAAAAAVAVAPGTASAQGGAAEGRSLMKVLQADGNKLDKTWGDFDITHRAVTTVLEAKPGSAVAVLADGSTRLTAFVSPKLSPTIQATRSNSASATSPQLRPPTTSRTAATMSRTFMPINSFVQVL